MNVVAVNDVLDGDRIQLVKLKRDTLSLARWRVIWIAMVFAVVSAAALIRIAYLGLADYGTVNKSFSTSLLPPRGEITDRNGIPLARAFPAYALWYNPAAMEEEGAPLVKTPEEIAAQLIDIFPELDEEALIDRLTSGRAGYLRRRVLPEEANRIQEIGELALEMPRENDRHYPQGTLASHVLGYIQDGSGMMGMEMALNDRLADPNTRGTPISLSLDVRVQGALEDELRRGMLAVDAIGAAGIVLDVDTGEVLALASLPEFDPNNVRTTDKVAPDNSNLPPPVFNRATNAVFELGSTIKSLTFASAIDAGIITTLSQKWDATPFKIGSYEFNDDKPKGDFLNVVEALMYSSNVVTARVADQLGEDALKQTFIDLGMHERPYIDLPAKGLPIWHNNWGLTRLATASYGHGLSFTPLHLASSYASLVNGGIWRPATLRKLGPSEVPRGRRVFKASTSARMRQLLRMTALYGTGRSADAEGYRVGGKTGSAEKPGQGSYRRNSLISTFAAAFPMDRPRYVIVAMLDEPRGTIASSYQRTASYTAGPIIGRLVPRIGPLLGVRPDGNRDIDLSDLIPLVRGNEI